MEACDMFLCISVYLVNMACNPRNLSLSEAAILCIKSAAFKMDLAGA
jgi:hypothetical protein